VAQTEHISIRSAAGQKSHFLLQKNHEKKFDVPGILTFGIKGLVHL